LGERRPGDGEVDRGREDAIMRNESQDHRRYANVYSIERRTGEESGGCSDLERGRSHKAEGSIVSENGLVSLISECYQTIENEEESRDIEKSERSVGPRLEVLIEADSPVMGRIERRRNDLRTGARHVRKPLTIRLEGIERPYRKQNHLR
jgi:hypothetical protein